MAIAFITGSRDYVFEGYEVSALHYLLKPLKYEDCAKCLDRVGIRTKQESDRSLVLEIDRKLRRIPCSTIIYIESLSHYLFIHTDQEVLRCRKSIVEVESALDADTFLRIHRSFIVNVSFIKEIKKREVILEDGAELPVSQVRWESVNRAFIQYNLEG